MITFFWRVTCVWARSLPLADAPVFRAIIVLDRMVPSECAVVPMVTAPAVCQNTFLACAPPVRITFLAGAWVSAPAIWKMKTSFGPPERVMSFVMDRPLVQE